MRDDDFRRIVHDLDRPGRGGDQPRLDEVDACLFAEACDREAHRVRGAGLGMGTRGLERGARGLGLALQLMDAALHIGGGHLPDRALFRRQRIDRIEVGCRPIVAFGPELDGAGDVVGHRGREAGACGQRRRAVGGRPRGLQPLQERFGGPRRRPEGRWRALARRRTSASCRSITTISGSGGGI